jgi:adenylate cyclase
MKSSKELLVETSISRATLNNYIKRGILSKPIVRQQSNHASGAKILGYFPDEAVETIRSVQRMKAEGLSMSEIINLVGKRRQTVTPPAQETARSPSVPSAETGKDGVRLTLEDVTHPAYMMSYSFELIWYNESARQHVLGFVTPPPESDSRNIFLMLLDPARGWEDSYRNELLRLHLTLAKARLRKESFRSMLWTVDPQRTALLKELYDDAECLAGKTIVELPYTRAEATGGSSSWLLYGVFFREGILIVHVPATEATSPLLDFLARRDVVIRSLLRKRLPVLTPLAVLVADLQNSVRICSELPPEEYFELINEIWSAMAPVFRKYYGTHGKHVGDGMVYYFFPQPDSNYIFNALACAQAVKMQLRKLSKDWQLRKNWLNELYLNIGLHEGQEWLGTFQSATSVEFAVLGQTINHAARLSDFARDGGIWATKNLISKLTAEERERVEFGITRRSEGDQRLFVPATYSQVESLVDLSEGRNEKLRDIATLPVTEVRAVKIET